jgi:hypothetical protein
MKTGYCPRVLELSYMYDKVKKKAYNTYKIRQAKKFSNLAKSQPRQFWKKIENLKDAPF